MIIYNGLLTSSQTRHIKEIVDEGYLYCVEAYQMPDHQWYEDNYRKVEVYIRDDNYDMDDRNSHSKRIMTRHRALPIGEGERDARGYLSYPRYFLFSMYEEDHRKLLMLWSHIINPEPFQWSIG